MKYSKKFSDVLEIKDLTRSKLKIEYIATITELPHYYFVTRLNEKGIFVGRNKAHFIKLSNAAKPEIIGSATLVHDNMYANQYVGIKDNFTLFSIAYQGIEIVDISDIANPRSLGINKEYGNPLRLLMAGNFGITHKNILDMTDIFKPVMIKEFDHVASDYLIYHDKLIYTPRGKYIKAIDLDKSSNFKELASLPCPFHYGFNRLEILNERYILAASGNGIAVAEISDSLENIKLESRVDMDLIEQNLVLIESSCITRTTRNPDDVIVSVNFSNPFAPVQNYSLSFNSDQLWSFTANKHFISCLCTNGLERKSGKKSVLILTNHLNSPPELVGEIKIDMSSDFKLIDDCIYEFTKEGMNIYQID